MEEECRLHHNSQPGRPMRPATQLRPGDGKPEGHEATSVRCRQQPNCLGAAKQPTHYSLRTPGQRTLPARFRCIQTASNETNGCITMESSNAKRRGRTMAQKNSRHERNKGPWTCGLCKRDAFGSIAGFPNHTIIAHQQNCSWKGKVTAPTDGDHLATLTSSVRRSQLHLSAKRQREANQLDEESSSTDQTPPATRCCRIRLSPRSDSPSTSPSQEIVVSATSQQVLDNALIRNPIPIIEAVRSTRVGRHSVQCQTPLTESLFLPEGLTLQLLLDVVHANPGVGADSLVGLVCQSRSLGLPDQQYIVVQLVLHGMVMAAGRIASVVQEQVQLLSNLSQF